jgi:hypothetical protein
MGKRRKYYVIEAGIPIPPKRFAGALPGSNRRYNFAEMDVGDSILLPATVNRVSLRTTIRKFQVKYPGRKFTSRVMEGGTTRGWRVQ